MAHAPAIPRHMSLADYEALVESGALAEANVELVDGQVLPMTPQGDEHATTIRTLIGLLSPAAHDLEVQLPLRLGGSSRPEPDLALAPQRTAARPPTTARLVIEVVVTQWQEAQRKLPVYAEARVGECWIVDVPKRRVLVHDRPTGRTYTRTRTFTGDDTLTPPGTDITFTAADVFAGLDDT